MKLLLHLSGHFLANCNLSALPALVGCGWVWSVFQRVEHLHAHLLWARPLDSVVASGQGWNTPALAKLSSLQTGNHIVVAEGRVTRPKRKDARTSFSLFACAVASAAEAGSGSVPVDEVVSYRSRKAE